MNIDTKTKMIKLLDNFVPIPKGYDEWFLRANSMALETEDLITLALCCLTTRLSKQHFKCYYSTPVSDLIRRSSHSGTAVNCHSLIFKDSESLTPSSDPGGS